MEEDKNTSQKLMHKDSLSFDLHRFGHTITLISSNEAVLFGGAKSINELYNDSTLFKVQEKTWVKLKPSGTIPSPRAAHASCCILKRNVLVFSGAKKNGGFASNELYFLDLKSEPVWSILTSKEPKPQPRYGHSLYYCKPFLILFGGVLKENNKLSNDLWIARIEYLSLQTNQVIEWKKIEFGENSNVPSPRLYHSLGIVKSSKAKGMIILFGGRDQEQKALNDCWGLRRHRNMTWEWIIAPKKGDGFPLKRFQHVALFYMNYMILVGGRSENIEMCMNGLPVEIYDTDKLEWHSLFSFDKFRHAAFTINKIAFLHGGCDMTNFNEEPSDLIATFDINHLCSQITNENNISMVSQNNILNGLLANCKNLLTQNTIIESSQIVNGINIKPIIVTKADLSCVSISNDSCDETEYNHTPNLSSISIEDISPMEKEASSKEDGSQINFSTFNKPTLPSTKKIVQCQVKTVCFEEKTKFQVIKNNEDEYFELYENFINTLLRPSDWKLNKKTDDPNGISKFKFRREHIIALTKACQEVVSSQPIVLRLSTPIKIFGDIHGQYDDLLRFFELWGEPSDKSNVGDISVIDYLFLGDYVDRGVYSLETICLLMALKIKYPEKIHLLRGNHEDYLINSTFGFLDECEYRLSDDAMCEELNVFKVINEFFEYLPLVAIIENEILCVHGGIGSCFCEIEDVEKIQRPCSVVHEAITKQDQIVMDILWSDPTDNDEEKGIQPNVIRDSKSYGNIVKFGPDIVQAFMEKNNIHMIIRAHECVPDGFERFCEGSLITVFSATDYCKRHKNAGAMLLLTSTYEIIPYLIYPVDSNKVKWLEKEEYLKKRPPTPPRRRSNKK